MRRETPPRIHPPQALERDHTGNVPTFTVLVSLRFDTAPGEDAVEGLHAALRPRDDALRLWQDTDPRVVRMTTDRAAPDLEAAVFLGHDVAAEALELSGSPGSALEVVAMTDEQQRVWRAEP
jgi:hypothetical protein